MVFCALAFSKSSIWYSLGSRAPLLASLLAVKSVVEMEVRGKSVELDLIFVTFSVVASRQSLQMDELS